MQHSKNDVKTAGPGASFFEYFEYFFIFVCFVSFPAFFPAVVFVSYDSGGCIFVFFRWLYLFCIFKAVVFFYVLYFLSFCFFVFLNVWILYCCTFEKSKKIPGCCFCIFEKYKKNYLVFLESVKTKWVSASGFAKFNFLLPKSANAAG